MSSEQLDLFPNEESSPEGSPAKTSPWQAVVKAWLEHALACSGRSCACWMTSLPVGSSLKTSLDSCHLTVDETWAPSSGRWQTSGMGGPTECWTLNTSEFPSDGDECSSSLGDILEPPTSPGLPRYFLSPKACEGILRRATRRGKKLPELLAVALEAVVGRPTPTA